MNANDPLFKAIGPALAAVAMVLLLLGGRVDGPLMILVVVVLVVSVLTVITAVIMKRKT